jgi:hypothetical protein
VIDLVLVNDQYLAHVTEHVQGGKGVLPRKAGRCLRLAKALALREHSHRTFQHDPNWIGGRFVDFGSCCFKNDLYKRGLISRVRASNGKRKAYQTIEGLGITGRRTWAERIKPLGLETLDLKGKDVLDLGCSLGEVLRWSVDKGARRAVGVDNKQARLAYEISNWLGYWNVDAFNLQLPGQWKKIRKLSGIPRFDVVFALAILKWTGGYRKWVKALLKPGGMLVVETHGMDGEEFPTHIAKEDFAYVRYIGKTSDLGKRKVYHAWRAR